ncbi:hypothetical protein RIF29_14458 [Crotalaria pallida]|uniref:Uncharacterized protein n=1 Tax=Crotalaria pallida TaxID=3830 RepID=A0AAN9FDE1_CROPI
MSCYSFSDTDSIDDCGNVEHKNVDVHREEHEGADDHNEPTKHADADVAPDVYTNILELIEADIWDDNISINDDSSSPASLGTRRQEDNEDMSSDENNIHDTSHLYESSKGKQKVNHRSTHKKAMKVECLTQISMDNSEMKPNTPFSMPKVEIRHRSYVLTPNQVSSNVGIPRGTYVLPPNHISPYAYDTPWQEMSMSPIYGVAPSYPPLTQVQFLAQMPTYFGGMPMDNTSGGTWVDMFQNVNKNACGSSENRSPPQ